jgi:hypothetical protein
MLSENDTDAPPAVAVRVAVWPVVTEATEAVKFTLETPAGTTLAAGIATLALLLERATATPPVGAMAVRRTVQVEVPGAFTVAGEQVIEPGCTGTGTVRPIDVDCVAPLSEALTVTF